MNKTPHVHISTHSNSDRTAMTPLSLNVESAKPISSTTNTKVTAGNAAMSEDLTSQSNTSDAITREPYRFLDLPAEMRLDVYRELLLSDGTCLSRKLHPQILATSKAVWEEAEDVLYGENALQVEVLERSLSHGRIVNILPFTSFEAKIFDHWDTSHNFWAVEEEWNRHAETLRKFKRVVFRMVYMPKNPFNNLDAAGMHQKDAELFHEQLYMLAVLLSGGRCKQLEIQLDGGLKLTHDDLQKGVGWALSKLGTSVQISSPGLPAALWKQHIQDAPEASIVVRQDLMRIWKGLEERAQAFIDLVELSGLQKTGISALKLNVQPIKQSFSSVHRSHRFEIQTAQRMLQFQSFLGEKKMVDLKERIMKEMEEEQTGILDGSQAVTLAQHSRLEPLTTNTVQGTWDPIRLRKA